MKLRVSYSLLRMWEAGRTDDALRVIFKGTYPPATDPMRLGIQFHKRWEEEIHETGCLPRYFGAEKLINPQTEVKVAKKLNDWLTLVIVMDCIHGKRGEIYDEFKSGRTKVGSYAASKQHCIAKILRPQLSICRYLSYNPYTGARACEIVHLTDKTFEEGLEYVVSLACDIRHTIETLKESGAKSV